MKSPFVSRIVAGVGGAVLTGVVLTSGTPAVAQADPSNAQGAGRCTDRTIRGDYGFSIEGTILAGTPNAFLLRGVAMTHFDGHGNTSQVDFVTRNGVPAGTDWRPATGTYDVDANCTGSATFSFEDGSPDLHLRLVDRKSVV